MRIDINPDNLTIGDLEDFEQVTGKAFDKVLAGEIQRDDEGNILRDEKGRPVTAVHLNATALKALVWISQRASNPEFSLEDARNVKVTELNLDVPADEDEGKGESATND